MSSREQLEVVLSPILPSDYTEVAEGNWDAFPTVYSAIEHPLPHAERLSTTLHRLNKLFAHPSVFGVKATLGSPSGPLAGIAIWHRCEKGDPIFHLKRRITSPEALAAETDEDRAAWAAVNPGWEAMWSTWDAARAEIMGDTKHFLLAPLWVKPEYQGKGIGGKLLQQWLDKADEEGYALYLEASRAGQPVYAKRGFVVEGKSEAYPEMVRWAKDVRERKAAEAAAATASS
ncbi:hypothetical protein RQP46_000127 [Phenoliferia psychrophenolica]